MMSSLLNFWRGEVTNKNALVEVRIGAQALHRFYRMVLLLSVVFMPWELTVSGSQRLEGMRLVIRLLWITAASGAIELNRRTYVRAGGLLITLFMLVLMGSEMVHYGGINVLVMAMAVPMMMRAFIQARREVIVSAIVLTALTLSGHIWLTWFADLSEHAPIYEPISAMVTFILMQAASALIMYLSASYAKRNVERLEQSRREFEIAKHYESTRRTEAEVARTRADLAMRAKSRFLANMSHELRTPLNAILGYSEMIEEELEDYPLVSAQCEPDVQRVKRAGSHLLEVINDILDLSRLEVERMPIHLQHVHALDLKERAQDYLARRHDDELLDRITWAPLPDALTIYGDLERLAQLLALGVLNYQAIGHISCEVDEVSATFIFSPGEAWPGESTDTLIDLRSVLRYALIEKLEVSCEEGDRRWSMCVPLPERAQVSPGDEGVIKSSAERRQGDE